MNTSKVEIKSIPSSEKPSEIRQEPKSNTFDNFPKINPLQNSPTTQAVYQSQSQAQYTIETNSNINKYSSNLQQPAGQIPNPIKNSPQPQPQPQPKNNNFSSPQLNSSSSYKQKNDLIYSPKV